MGSCGFFVCLDKIRKFRACRLNVAEGLIFFPNFVGGASEPYCHTHARNPLHTLYNNLFSFNRELNVLKFMFLQMTLVKSYCDLNSWTLIVSCFRRFSAHVQNFLYIQNLSHVFIYCCMCDMLRIKMQPSHNIFTRSTCLIYSCYKLSYYFHVF